MFLHLFYFREAKLCLISNCHKMQNNMIPKHYIYIRLINRLKKLYSCAAQFLWQCYFTGIQNVDNTTK